MSTSAPPIVGGVIGHEHVIEAFHIEAYNSARDGRSWGGATYMGIKLWKWPCDLHLYQELVWELKPRTIIETGTAFGGSALYFAHLLDAIGAGKVVSIDLEPVASKYPRHPRIAYIGGRSSVDSGVVNEVQRFHDFYGWPVLVVLDSDHAKDHVLAELRAYASFVPPGSWLVVEDTNVNGHPVYPDHGPGPQEALDEWLPKHPEFKPDERKAGKFLWSMHTWLRRQRV
jgi:cephalosporin hydroxylase